MKKNSEETGGGYRFIRYCDWNDDTNDGVKYVGYLY